MYIIFGGTFLLHYFNYWRFSRGCFLTLFEHSVLGYIQIRMGPNKVGFCGILQPSAIKEQTFLIMSNYPNYLAPAFSLMLYLLIWVCIPFVSLIVTFSLFFLFFYAALEWGFMWSYRLDDSQRSLL